MRAEIVDPVHGLCWVGFRQRPHWVISGNGDKSAIDDPEARAVAVWDWDPGEVRTMPGLRVPGVHFCAAGTTSCA
jgi:hypothetical protein